MIEAINWDVSPTLIQLGPLEVRWYGLFFALGLLVFGPKIEERMWKREGLKEEWLNKLFVYVVVATVLGARLGHVLFYNPTYYLAHPLDIFKIWEGGLASHGGTIALIIACYLYAQRVVKKPLTFVLDRLAVPVGLVAAMIRLGNLMNSEIFGHLTDKPWGFRFVRSMEYRNMVDWPKVNAGDQLISVPYSELPKAALEGMMGAHPTQIYEALAYLLVFGISMWLYFYRDAARRRPGLIVGVFLIGVFGARLIIERLKVVQEPWELDLIAQIGLNMGQLLSLPFILLGGFWVFRALTKKPVEAN